MDKDTGCQAFNLSLVPGSHVVEGEKELVSQASWYPLHIHKVVKLMVSETIGITSAFSQGPGHSLQARPAMGLPYTPVILSWSSQWQRFGSCYTSLPQSNPKVICGCCVHCHPSRTPGPALTPYTPQHLLLSTTASAPASVLQ